MPKSTALDETLNKMAVTEHYVQHCAWQKAVKSASWEEIERLVVELSKVFTLLVQLSCVCKHYKDERREKEKGSGYSMPGYKHSFEKTGSSCRG